MARRSKRSPEEEASTKAPKPQKVPEKLARPFEEAMKAIAAQKKAQFAQPAPQKPAPAKPKAEKGNDPRLARAASVSARAPDTAPSAALADTSLPAAKRPVDAMAHYGYDDRAAFHQAFAGVRPLPATKTPRRSGQTGPISDEERRERARVAAKVDEAEQLARARLDSLVSGGVKFLVEHDDDSVYGRRTDAPDRTIDTLLARKNAPVVKIDLHGLDSRAATEEVSRRIRESARRGVTDVIIVHGKGLHSDGGKGVLGDVAVKALTSSAAAQHVVAFATAPMRFGGNGALLVKIDRR